MRKQWAAMLSMLGLAGPVVRVQAQVLKGSSQPVTNEKNGATNKSVKTGATAQKTTGNAGKLNVNQQTLRTNQGTGGKQADPLTPSAYCAGKQGSANNQLTPPPPGSVGNNAKTNNAAVTKTGRDSTAVTKTGRDNTAVTKTGRDNTAVTKTGRDSTAVTKTGRDNTAVTKTGRDSNLNVNQQKLRTQNKGTVNGAPTGGGTVTQPGAQQTATAAVPK